MKISATITNGSNLNDITVSTEANKKKISIPGKAEGFGSSVNGGELLFLSLATCFCNDIYREAVRRKMNVQSVEATVWGEFGGEGKPATFIEYEARIQSPGSSAKQMQDLIEYVDKIAEIHNTLRKGIQVSLKNSKK